ncbi:uncharacterized protein LOC122831823 isoform X2 [Gambusia affinis]|uniref:uncharacterized protein LOC122831823 isoform X2 n=1 Tax=Gambusia affinis TaxID=33528 RepID=UPI001CDD41FD|nr:uncharacterized protein LOC122831823 isoform X2 [Gambusia affinis]
MSVSVDANTGVTAVTIATDNRSKLAQRRQIVRALPCGPSWRSGSKGSSVVGALGIVQIMVGVFNVVLGPERAETFPYWLGVPFIAAGVLSLLADRFPFRCLKLLRGVDITMIVMSVLQLCVCISLAVLGNKAFYYRWKYVKDVLIQQPLFEDGHMTSPGA